MDESNIPREDQQDAQQWAEEDDGITREMQAMARRTTLFRAFLAKHKVPQDAAAAGYVTYQLTQEETDVFLAEDQAAPSILQLRLRITQALREAGDPAHVDVLLADGTIGWTMDIR